MLKAGTRFAKFKHRASFGDASAACVSAGTRVCTAARGGAEVARSARDAETENIGEEEY